jgi:hypothetical protein
MASGIAGCLETDGTLAGPSRDHISPLAAHSSSSAVLARIGPPVPIGRCTGNSRRPTNFSIVETGMSK